ncbi:MAG: DUF1156 domain-containing protein, partial [Synergistales bacterium]|nr:DUF1156 domain-containing protein [Synergistales bacterium]
MEAGFPCHQVGAETQRERDTGQAPPVNRLHVWWARRPLTPSRAAILGSILPADTDPDWFLQELGIEKRVVRIGDQEWVLTGKALDLVEIDEKGKEYIQVSPRAINLISKENENRRDIDDFLEDVEKDGLDTSDRSIVSRWKVEVGQIPLPAIGENLAVERMKADPSWSKAVMQFTGKKGYRFPGDPYGYSRAFTRPAGYNFGDRVVLDLTSGGGSIPFEALRCGCKVVANELNPVASVILKATLDYPSRFGVDLVEDLQKYGAVLATKLEERMSSFFPEAELAWTGKSQQNLEIQLDGFEEMPSKEGILDYLFNRQVTCPHCGGDAPLLNTCWLAKGSGDKWGVEVVTDGSTSGGKVRFKTYPVVKGKGPEGQDPELSTVARGVGQCVHCRQTIDADEIKRQARGESPHGRWKDVLYAVAAVRYQPKLDGNGRVQRYKTGAKAGQIKTEKVRFFRPPNQADLSALDEAQRTLEANWDRWDDMGLIPTEAIPEAHKTKEPLRAGMSRWCDMFTPRQLLGHLTLVEELNSLKPRILSELGEERGRAVVTYLQFAIDKGLDYNSRQTRW